MPRAPRISFPGAVFHVVCRGNGGNPVFLDDADRARYLKVMERYRSSFKFLLFAYCLMDNHVHLLLEVTETPVSKALQAINTAYTMYFNIRHHRRGHLFQGRFYSSLVEKQAYLLEVSRYIHLNPVRAGLVDTAAAWQWSSCDAYLGQNHHKAVDSTAALKLFGFSDPARQYAAFLADGVEHNRSPALPVIVKNGYHFVATARFVHRVTHRYGLGVGP